ncbi:MAG: hypothetical protein ACKPFD_11660 [Dolichospermum sp.]
MNDETLVVRASCPLNMYLITPGSAVYPQLLKEVGDMKTAPTNTTN